MAATKKRPITIPAAPLVPLNERTVPTRPVPYVDEADVGTPPFPGFQYTTPGASETTQLNPQEEQAFQTWVTQNKVPWQDSPTADYDMRGFYKALQSGDPEAKQSLSGYDGTMHFPDTYKTKYHPTFSDESKYATRPNAPHWANDRLIDERGNILADETPPPVPMNTTAGVLPGRNGLALVPNRPDFPTRSDDRFGGAPAPEYSQGMGATRPILVPPASPSVTAQPEATETAPTGAPAEVPKDYPSYRGPQDDLASQFQHLLEYENKEPDKMSRKRAMAAGALRGLGMGLQSGNIGTGVGAAIAGATGGFIAPKRQAKMEHDAKVAEEYAKFGKRIKTADTLANLRYKQAQAGEIASRPIVKLAELKGKEREQAISRVMTQWAKLDHYDPSDKNDAGSQSVAQQAAELNLNLAPRKKGSAATGPGTVHIGSDGIPRIWNHERNQFEVAQGLPPETMVETQWGRLPLKDAIQAVATSGQSIRMSNQFAETQYKQSLETFNRRQSEANVHYGKYTAARQKYERLMTQSPKAKKNSQGQWVVDPDEKLDWEKSLQDARDDMNVSGGALQGYPEYFQVDKDKEGLFTAKGLTPKPPQAPTPQDSPSIVLPGRGGATTTGTATTPKLGTKGSDGLIHYKLADVQKMIDPKTGLNNKGQRLEEFLATLRKDSRIHIDDDNQ